MSFDHPPKFGVGKYSLWNPVGKIKVIIYILHINISDCIWAKYLVVVDTYWTKQRTQKIGIDYATIINDSIIFDMISLI